MSERWPDFLIIGAQKAGTSWLHARMSVLPSLWLPPDKDFDYFSFPGQIPVQRFLQRFEPAPPDARVGDACASYFWTTGHGPDSADFSDDPAADIDTALGPEARYIVLLRDPVERSLSAYLHHIAHGSLDAGVSLLDAPRAHLGLVDISRYGTHLERWLRRVGPRRLRILPSPSEAPPRTILGDAMRFLGIDAPLPDDVESTVFPGLERFRDETGVWVALGQSGVRTPVGPVVERSGRRWTRLVDTGALAEIEARLRPDIHRLAIQLEAIEQVSPVFRRWSTWPADR